MSGRFGLKRKYQSGASKRRGRDDKYANAVKNTAKLSSYFNLNNDNNEETESGERGLDEDIVEQNVLEEGNIAENENDEILVDMGTEVNEANELDMSDKYPTDRGNFPGDIQDPSLKRAILEHGSCRPTDNFFNTEGKVNFTASYYFHTVDNIQIPRQWICYSPKLKRPYCEVCWLFADRNECSRVDYMEVAELFFQLFPRKVEMENLIFNL